MAGITEAVIVKLARDVARDIQPIGDILKGYKLTAETFDEISRTKVFQTILVEELAAWQGDIRQRISAKSAAIVEEALPVIFDDIVDRSLPLTQRVEALKLAARLASMEQGAQPIDKEERVVFNIQIGETQLRFEQQRAEPREIEGEVLPNG